jgi:guanylate kinase
MAPKHTPVNQTKGKLIIFTAPSGAGKTTIVRHLLSTFPEQLAFSVSATTRSRRNHEVGGRDYYFLSAEAFRKHISDGDFLEWEEVYAGQFYGTLRSEVDRLLAQGRHVIFDIDVEGALNLKCAYGDRAMAVFVQPPSEAILVERLKNRNTETPESLARRIAKATKELAFANKFDKVLVNDVLEKTLTEAENLILKFLKLRTKHGNTDNSRHQG